MGRLIYITGLSGSGKTTIAKELQKYIPNSILLDGDIIRSSINTDLGYDFDSKLENIRRNNSLIEMLYNQGFTIIAAFMSSIGYERDKIFEICKNNIKVQLTTPVEVCFDRDVKGLYKNKLDNFAGVTSQYDEIKNPDLKLDTSVLSKEKCLQQINAIIAKYNESI